MGQGNDSFIFVQQQKGQDNQLVVVQNWVQELKAKTGR